MAGIHYRSVTDMIRNPLWAKDAKNLVVIRGEEQTLEIVILIKKTIDGIVRKLVPYAIH